MQVLDIPGSSIAEQLLAMSWELACSVVDDKEFVPRELIDLKVGVGGCKSSVPLEDGQKGAARS